MMLDALSHPLATFWMGYAPLGGAWRIYLYGGLLAQALSSAWHSPPHGDSPLNAPEVVAGSDPAFYQPAGVMRVFGRWGADPRALGLVRAVTAAAWIACLVGFGGRWAAALVALGAFFLHGAMSGALGTNHRWVVPIHVLAGAALVDLNVSWSLDAWLAARWPAYPFAPGAGPLVPSGFLGQFALLIAVYSLAAGGVSKLRLGGRRWLDGESLRFFISRPGVGAWADLNRLLAGRAWACRALAVATIALEFGALAALFVPGLRVPVLASAALFHLGIWLTMNPNYLPQTWCYALCLGGASAAAAAAGAASPWAVALAYGASLLAAGLAVVACRGIEHWPLTCIPMYAFYRGPAARWPHEALQDEEQARQLGREFVASRLPYPLSWSEQWVGLRLVAGDGSARDFKPAGVLRKHWNRLLHRAAALQFAAPDSSAARDFLESHRDALVAGLTSEESAAPGAQIHFVGRMSSGERVLGALAIASDGRAENLEASHG
jgi:hypothetical protein